MDIQYYALKLLPCRPTFAFDMTDEERAIMTEHVGYLTNLLNEGTVKVFGPVFDQSAPYGFAIVKAGSDDQIREIIANDPASKLNKYEYSPMRAVFPE